MNRVLVTGAGGFIGRRSLAPLAGKGLDVHAVTRGPVPPSGTGVTWHRADLLDDGQRCTLVRSLEPSHLLHLAWFADPGVFWSAPENASWVAGTIRLLEEFAAAGGKRAILAGSCAEYDWSCSGPLSEEAPLRPATFYGACKDATRRVAEGLAEVAGLSLAWGRVFFVYGPGEDRRRLVAATARALLAGERAPTTEGSQQRDLMHVDDVAAAFVALLMSHVVGPVNLGTGEAVPIRSVVEQIAAASGRPDLLDVGALPSRPGEPKTLVAEVTRLREEVGFLPNITLADGIETTVAWWRDRLTR